MGEIWDSQPPKPDPAGGVNDRSFIVVVQVIQLSEGRHLLIQDGTGSPDQGGCASGDAVDVGGFWWCRGLVVRGGCCRLSFRGCRFFPAPGAEDFVIRQRGPAVGAEVHAG